jgi:hypothetical protein
VQAPEFADVQPSGIEIAVPSAALRFGDEERRGAGPSELLPPLPASWEFPAGLAEAAMALARGGNVTALLPAGRDHGRTARVGSTPDGHLDPRRGLELPHEWGRQRGGCVERDADACTGRFFDRQPEAPGDHVLPAEQQATNLGVASDRRVGRGVLPRGDGGHRLAPCGLRGIIAHQLHGVSRLRGQGLEPLLCLLLQRGLGIPALSQEEVLEPGPMVLGLQSAV